MATEVTKPRQRGRPSKAARLGEKTTLSLRVIPETKDRLDKAASASGRNLSQEAELRLENSFRDGDTLDQALVLAYGNRTTALLLGLGSLIRDVGIVAISAKGKPTAADAWLDDAFAFRQVIEGIEKVFADPRVRPEGDASAPAPVYLNVVGDQIPDWASKVSPFDFVGVGTAGQLIEDILPKLSARKKTK